MLLGKRHGPCTLGEIVTKMRLEALGKHSQPQTMTRLRDGGREREREESFIRKLTPRESLQLLGGSVGGRTSQNTHTNTRTHTHTNTHTNKHAASSWTINTANGIKLYGFYEFIAVRASERLVIPKHRASTNTNTGLEGERHGEGGREGDKQARTGDRREEEEEEEEEGLFKANAVN